MILSNCLECSSHAIGSVLLLYETIELKRGNLYVLVYLGYVGTLKYDVQQTEVLNDRLHGMLDKKQLILL